MSEELDRRIRDALRMTAAGYDPRTPSGERFPRVEREVLRRRRARAFAVTLAASVIVATIALSTRLDHPATTRDAEQGFSTTGTTAVPGGAAPGGNRIAIVPTPSGPGASTTPADGAAGHPSIDPGARAGSGTTGSETGVPASATSGSGTAIQTGGSGGASPTSTSPAMVPATTTPVSPTTATPTTVTTPPVTPTTVTPTSVPTGIVRITSTSGSTVDVTVGWTLEVDLQPSCPGSTWTSPRSNHPSILEPTAGPPATTPGAVVGWFIAAAPGPAQLTATVTPAACVTPAAHFDVMVKVSR